MKAGLRCGDEFGFEKKMKRTFDQSARVDFDYALEKTSDFRIELVGKLCRTSGHAR